MHGCWGIMRVWQDWEVQLNVHDIIKTQLLTGGTNSKHMTMSNRWIWLYSSVLYRPHVMSKSSYMLLRTFSWPSSTGGSQACSLTFHSLICWSHERRLYFLNLLGVFGWTPGWRMCLETKVKKKKQLSGLCFIYCKTVFIRARAWTGRRPSWNARNLLFLQMNRNFEGLNMLKIMKLSTKFNCGGNVHISLVSAIGVAKWLTSAP